MLVSPSPSSSFFASEFEDEVKLSTTIAVRAESPLSEETVYTNFLRRRGSSVEDGLPSIVIPLLLLM